MFHSQRIKINLGALANSTERKAAREPASRCGHMLPPVSRRPSADDDKPDVSGPASCPSRPGGPHTWEVSMLGRRSLDRGLAQPGWVGMRPWGAPGGSAMAPWVAGT